MLYAHFTTSDGNFTARLFDAETPNTVANFSGLADGSKEWTDPRTGRKVKQPYFNGTVFHRVIEGFMIQGGDPLGQGTGGPGYTFGDEFHPKLRHSKAGILSMANRGPNSFRRFMPSDFILPTSDFQVPKRRGVGERPRLRGDSSPARVTRVSFLRRCRP